MNKNVLSQLIGIGLLLVVLASLVGCGLGQVEQAAASSSTTSAVNSNAGIDPADWKFFDGGYMTNLVASNSTAHLPNIDPADRKFFTAPYLTAPVTAIDPADRKFFDGGYLANYAASESLDHLSKVDPADRKFFNGVYFDANGMARLAAGGDPANRNSSSGN